MRRWRDGFVEWVEGDTAYLSVVFSWKLPVAYQRAVWYREQGYRVVAGGPAVWVRPKYLAEITEIGEEYPEAVVKHNPLATFASKGCPVGCYFCIVPRMEGKAFTLLPDFTPRPILCDNNLSALPVDYQEYIIKRYQEWGIPLLDANSGFEPRTFDEDTYYRWKQINRGPWRFGFDEIREREDVFRVLKLLRNESARRKRIYVLIGNEPKEVCLERVMLVIEWGGEPHVQPLMALNTLVKRPLVRYDWTERDLIDMTRWANRWIWRKVGFDEYRRSVRNVREKAGTPAYQLC